MSLITLTTDFGLKDPYAAEMKGVILSLNRAVQMIDVSHQVTPQNIMEGALALSQAYPLFPDGTIHLAVVDPGVGGTRRPIVIETKRYFFVGPDNGLFTQVVQSETVKRIIHLTESRYFRAAVSRTFHGRDIFAPVAAHLTLGVEAGALGEEIDDPCLLKMPFAMIGEGKVSGEIIYKDGFGNLVSNITEEEIDSLGGRDQLVVELNKKVVRKIRKTYSDAPLGGLVALVGSMGFLEIACNGGSAAELLNVREGESVEVSVRR